VEAGIFFLISGILISKWCREQSMFRNSDFSRTFSRCGFEHLRNPDRLPAEKLCIHPQKRRELSSMNKKERINRQSPPSPLVKSMTRFRADQADPQGSYTGCPNRPEDPPVQDADDL
jgi:hypothetical protein